MVKTKIPREKIPWFPTIDYEKCEGCQECFKFCRNGVYIWDEENKKPVVKNPYNCIVLCSTCAGLCENEAIKFPDLNEIRKLMKELGR